MSSTECTRASGGEALSKPSAHSVWCDSCLLSHDLLSLNPIQCAPHHHHMGCSSRPRVIPLWPFYSPLPTTHTQWPSPPIWTTAASNLHPDQGVPLKILARPFPTKPSTVLTQPLESNQKPPLLPGAPGRPSVLCSLSPLSLSALPGHTGLLPAGPTQGLSLHWPCFPEDTLSQIL